MAEPTDVLVIGSGVAGMWFALKAADHCCVTMITKDEPQESNSRYAQGGIAAVWSDDDNFENHVSDTLVAGAGLCRREAVEQTVREGPDRVRDLISVGTQFTRALDDPNAYDLHQEGGHSHRRILHAQDFTGREIVRALHEACARHPNIKVLGHHMAVDLVTERWLARREGAIPPEDDRVLGAYVLDQKAGPGAVEVFPAKATVVATGGAGRVYQFTTNPRIATGDGIAMAWRAGARIANMEFVQFHPTCLFHDKVDTFLVSEALRGEGGTLILPDGQRFMPEVDERAELAPRDIVARAIDREIKRRGLECVHLDMRHLDRASVEQKFPNIDGMLRSLGIDMTVDPIPVVPAAHYMCGGVQTRLSGESSIRNLFVVGEASCTGLHGANRLASNSLLEAVVFAQTAAETLVGRMPGLTVPAELPSWDPGSAVDPDELVVVRQTWKEIRSFMSNYVGIQRTHKRLRRALRRIRFIKDEVTDYYWDFKLTTDLVELRNLMNVSDMIIKCALRRQESRGLHFIQDFPKPDARFVGDTVIERWL